MTKEEMVYEDALEILEKAMKGETVNQTSLTIASLIMQNVFPRIFDERLRNEMAKAAEAWQSDLKE